MKIDAKVLQDALSFLGLAVSKIVSSRPITKMLELKTDGSFLVGTTCDDQTFLHLKICPTSEDLNALVEFELFNNIIKSCTGEIELKEATNAISIKSSSMKCKVPSSFNRPNTSMPTIPMIECSEDTDFTGLSSVLPICKSILKPDFSIDCYRNIFFGDVIMVTDTDNVAVVSKKFFNTPVLLSYKVAEILSKLKNAKYAVTEEVHKHTKREFKKLYVKTETVELICISNYMQQFQYDDLAELFKLVEHEFTIVNKAELSKGYSVAKNFKNAIINLVFDTEGVFVTIPKSDFVYKVSDCKTKNKWVFVATDDLMKKILTLPDNIEINILDNMIRCASNGINEIFSVVEGSEDTKTSNIPNEDTTEEIPF